MQINIERLQSRMDEMGKIGVLKNGGVTRLTLTDEDKAARDLLKKWMLNAGLEIIVDQIGNMFGIRKAKNDLPAIMTGSHLDTVGEGGLYDGSLGVLAGLELIETLNDKGIETNRPIILANFTNEEGVRFTPDMMGSLVYSGQFDLKKAYQTIAIDGTNSNLESELTRIGYKGDFPCGGLSVSAFIELHIEQGPVLEMENLDIGIVENLQGISWTAFKLKGESNHAGTTPMKLRKDAGLVAMRIGTFVRDLVAEAGGNQVGTIGTLNFGPNLINVVPGEARMTVDLRNTDNSQLVLAEEKLVAYANEIAAKEGVGITTEKLVRFDPVIFDEQVCNTIEIATKTAGLKFKRMYSGAGHDAQMMAKVCPTAMIFVPSENGISHNPKEFTPIEKIEAGANVLLASILNLAK